MRYPENTLTIAEGDSLRISVSIEEDGQPQDVTGATLFFTVKKLPTDPDRKILLGLEVPYVAEFTPGNFILNATPAQMMKLRAGGYFYDMRLIKAGVVTTLVAASPLEVVAVVRKDLSA
jgi:hypothetical protein